MAKTPKPNPTPPAAPEAKGGARHNAEDVKSIQAIHDSARALGADCKAEPAAQAAEAKSLAAALAKKCMGWGEDPNYAAQEGFDISQAGYALSGLGQLAADEAREDGADPEDVKQIATSIYPLLDFIHGEVDEMVAAAEAQAAAAAAEENPELVVAAEPGVIAEAKRDRKLRVAGGDEVKALGGGKIGGYLVRFGNEDEPDLSPLQDFFSAKTYFGAHAGDGMDTTIHHGIPLKDSTDPDEIKLFREIADQLLPPIKTTLDKVGLFAETVLDMADQYQAMVYDLTEKKKLRWSSGAVDHMVKRTRMPNGTHRIDQWIIGEAALTPTPAEPRLGAVVPIKSLTRHIPPKPAAQADPKGARALAHSESAKQMARASLDLFEFELTTE